MPSGHEHIPIYLVSINACLSGTSPLKVFQNKIVMDKKDHCAVFECNTDCLIPKKFKVKDRISNTKRV